MRMNKRLTKISKYLSFILKHNPQSIGLQPNADGWLNIDELIKNANANGKSITLEHVRTIVASHDEKRFALSDDGLQIRAI